MTTVDVLVPTFNGAPHLADTLDAILGQSHEDIRVIVSDDGSTDQTVALSRAIAKRDHRVEVRSSDRLGWAGNTNRLLGAVESDYFVILPQDDLIAHNYLEVMLEVLANGDAIAAVSDVSALGRLDTVVAHEACDGPPWHRVLGFIASRPNGVAFRAVTRSIALSTGLKLHETPPASFHADTTYVAELLARGHVSRVAQPLYRKRYHRDSVMASMWDAMPERDRVTAFARHTITLAVRCAEYPWPQAGRRRVLKACLDRMIRVLHFDDPETPDHNHAELGRVAGVVQRLDSVPRLRRWSHARLDLARAIQARVRGDHAAALDHVSRAIRRDGEYGEARILRAALWMAEGHTARAGREVDAALLSQPWNPWVGSAASWIRHTPTAHDRKDQ